MTVPPTPLHVLTISGSLRSASSNSRLLRAAKQLAPIQLVLEPYEGLGTLPHFNPDLDGPSVPEPVAMLRRLVSQADGLLISSPEYARGVPGTLKNALDWLVGGPEMSGKPVALLNASPRATHAQAQLAETLGTMAARVLDAGSATLPLLGAGLDERGIVATPALAEPLRRALAAFSDALRALTPDRR